MSDHGKRSNLYLGLVPIPDKCPWFYVDDELSKGLTAELKSEVGSEHFLNQWRNKLVVIAKCEANDDVLVVHEEDFGILYWVHLTHIGKFDQVSPGVFPSAGPVPNSDLIQFFRTYMQDGERHDPFVIKNQEISLMEAVTKALIELEKSDEIVVCAPTANRAASKLLEIIRPFTRFAGMSSHDLEQIKDLVDSLSQDLDSRSITTDSLSAAIIRELRLICTKISDG